jgi:hypothetical protein
MDSIHLWMPSTVSDTFPSVEVSLSICNNSDTQSCRDNRLGHDDDPYSFMSGGQGTSLSHLRSLLATPPESSHETTSSADSGKVMVREGCFGKCLDVTNSWCSMRKANASDQDKVWSEQSREGWLI